MAQLGVQDENTIKVKWKKQKQRHICKTYQKKKKYTYIIKALAENGYLQM